MTVIGKFTANVYLIRYYVGDQLLAEDSVEYGADIVLLDYTPEDSERYTFEGWEGEKYETMPAHDIIIQADETNAVLELSNKKQTNGYFQPNGLRLLAPKRKDLNIIRYSDGTTRKVLVK